MQFSDYSIGLYLYTCFLDGRRSPEGGVLLMESLETRVHNTLFYADCYAYKLRGERLSDFKWIKGYHGTVFSEDIHTIKNDLVRRGIMTEVEAKSLAKQRTLKVFMIYDLPRVNAYIKNVPDDDRQLIIDVVEQYTPHVYDDCNFVPGIVHRLVDISVPYSLEFGTPVEVHNAVDKASFDLT